MLIQGKEKRAVAATHEPLVDTDTFDAIQRSFQSKAFNLTTKGQSTENVLKGKVICGCCSGKMQRKRGTNHADWYFFTCITKNRLGVGKCTGMYVREEDVFHAIYHQLKLYVNEHSPELTKVWLTVFLWILMSYAEQPQLQRSVSPIRLQTPGLWRWKNWFTS